jgi:hypothetical protein
MERSLLCRNVRSRTLASRSLTIGDRSCAEPSFLGRESEAWSQEAILELYCDVAAIPVPIVEAAEFQCGVGKHDLI